MHKTAFAGLTALDPGDSITIDGGSFLYGNTDVTDRLLQVGAVTHRHDAHSGLPDPVGQLRANMTLTGGQLEPNVSIYMGYTLLDEDGGETALSPVVVTNTQGQIYPNLPPPSAAVDYTAGDLPIGGYSYAFSYRDAAGGQTELQPAVFLTRQPGHASGQVILSGIADGLVDGLVSWEVWRADEGGEYNLLEAGGTANTFTDTGFKCTDCTATPPALNTTNHTSELTVQLPSTEDDPGIDVADSIRVYFSTDGSFSTPALYETYPVASAGETFPVTSLVLGTGAPPATNRSLMGAHKIDADTELEGPWRRAVADEAALPATENTDGDIRETLNDHALHIWSAEAKAWDLLEGGGAGGGSGHVIQDPASVDMPPEAKLQFTGAVNVSDDPEHQRTVIRVASGEIINYRDAWASGTTYSAGDAVARDGGSYLALTTNTGVDPGTDEGVHWGILAIPGADGRGSAAAIDWRGPWSNSATYFADDVVSSEGGSYISLASGNIGNAPVSDRTHWGIIALPGHGFMWRGPWSGATTYEAQDVVEREGASYVSRINENTGVDPLEDVGHTHWNLFVARGKEGPAGPKGAPGASGVAGMRWRGPWNASAAYIPNDVVGRGGSSVINIASSNIGIDPETDAFVHWQMAAERGERGASGASGTRGADGAPGPAGAKGTAGLRNRGEWDKEADYELNDVVFYGGNYYVSEKGGNVDHVPSEGGGWWTPFKGEGPIESKVWADRGPIETGTRPPFPIFIGSAEESQRLIVVAFGSEVGKGTFTLTHNGSPITGLTGIKFDEEFKEKRLAKTKKEEEEGVPPAIVLKTGDRVGMIIESVEEEPLDLSITAFVEHIVWGDAEGGGTHEGPRGPEGDAGPRGLQGIPGPSLAVQAASGLELHDQVMLDFVGSGGVGVGLTDLGGGSARVTVGVSPDNDTSGGTDGIAVQVASGLELDKQVMLDFVASGNATVGLTDLGGGSARITIAASGGGGGGGGEGPLTIGAYTAEAEVGFNEPHEISPTESSIVFLTIQWGAGESEWLAELFVDGIKVGKAYLKNVRSGSEEWPIPFLLAAGKSYEVKLTGSTSGVKLLESHAPISGNEGTPGAAGEAGAAGAAGKDGVTILNGKGAPGSGLGSNGDFYIDTEAWYIYGPKASGTWPSGVPLATGPAGPPGPQSDLAVQVASGMELYDQVMLDFVGSGGVGVGLTDLGGGSARITIGESGGGGGGGVLKAASYIATQEKPTVAEGGTPQMLPTPDEVTIVVPEGGGLVSIYSSLMAKDGGSGYIKWWLYIDGAKAASLFHELGVGGKNGASSYSYYVLRGSENGSEDFEAFGAVNTDVLGDPFIIWLPEGEHKIDLRFTGNETEDEAKERRLIAVCF